MRFVYISSKYQYTVHIGISVSVDYISVHIGVYIECDRVRQSEISVYIEYITFISRYSFSHPKDHYVYRTSIHRVTSCAITFFCIEYPSRATPPLFLQLILLLKYSNCFINTADYRLYYTIGRTGAQLFFTFIFNSALIQCRATAERRQRFARNRKNRSDAGRGDYRRRR